MSLSSSHKIPEIQKLLKELEKEANYHEQFKANRFNNGYARGIEHCIEKIREIIDSA